MCIQVLFLPVNCVCAVLFLPVLRGVYAGVVLPVTLCAGAVFTCYSVCVCVCWCCCYLCTTVYVQVLFLPVALRVCVCRCCFTCYVYAGAVSTGYIVSMYVLYLLHCVCVCVCRSRTQSRESVVTAKHLAKVKGR